MSADHSTDIAHEYEVAHQIGVSKSALQDVTRAAIESARFEPGDIEFVVCRLPANLQRALDAVLDEASKGQLR